MGKAALIAGAVALAAAFPAAALASDAVVKASAGGLLAEALAAERAARGGDSTASQAAYDAARNLQETVRSATPTSSGCRRLQAALTQTAATLVGEQEAFDRLQSSARSRAQSAIPGRVSAVRAAEGACDGRRNGATPVNVSMQPATGEVFYGTIVARAPAGATRVTVLANGNRWRDTPLAGTVVRFTTTGRSQAYAFRMTFTNASGAVVGAAAADNTWLLPPSAKRARPGRRSSASASAALASAARSFNGTSGMWVQDLTNGTYAGWNAGAKFPGASLVKMGLMAGALARMGSNPQGSKYFYDLQQIAGWSSNLAANRIVDKLGSGCGTSRDALANDGLRRLGAKSSTYTGCYIIGTELQPNLPEAPATASPSLDTSRFTTAQDLARMMFAIQATAANAPGARQETGLTAKQARLILGLLLGSQQELDNASLFAGGLPAGMPLAQKNGWLRAARGGAALAFTPAGPLIMTLVAHSSSGVSLPAARALGNREATIARTLGGR